MSERVIVAALSVVLLAMPARAQDPMAQYQKLGEAMEKAEREAVRPGDERLDCGALEQQLVSAVNAPAVQDYIAKAGRQAEQDRARIRPDPAAMTAQAAVTAFSSIVPGGGWLGMAAAAGQAAGAHAQAAQTLQQRMQQANDMVAILPNMVRGQRLIELAQAKKCDWAPAEGTRP
jgi:hypothetical protein